MKKTPFTALHASHGARLVDFAGWEMPVQYTSIVEEHRNVRARVGLFDVSHMGRIMLTGAQHEAFTDWIATNARRGMRPGQIRYNLICNEGGTILDDVLVYAALKDGSATAAQMKTTPVSALSRGGTMIVCNAGNRDKITAWIEKQRVKFDVTVTDASESHAMLALQGPASTDVLAGLTSIDLGAIKYYRFTVGTVCGIADVIVSRTGYTGEDGFELIFPCNHAEKVFQALLDSGKKVGLQLTGLGARDTLRLEAGMPLYGHEIDDTINPIEAGLSWGVNFDKDFCGKAPLAAIAKNGAPRRMMGLLVGGKRIARQGHRVLHGGKPISIIASGTMSPTLERVIATALIPAALAKPGQVVEVEMRPGVVETASLMELPFYSRKK